MPSQKKISQKAINKNMTDFSKSSQLQDKRLNTIYGMSIEDKLHGRRRTNKPKISNIYENNSENTAKGKLQANILALHLPGG